MIRALPALGLLACAGGDGPAGTGSDAPDGPLVDHAVWVAVDAADDPFADHRPEPVTCPPSAWKTEGESLEADTGACDWFALGQPLKGDLRAGEPLELIFWTGWLTSEVPAEGHLALAVDGRLLAEWFVPIPSDPMAFSETFDAPFDADAGAPVVLHLHNHGANVWNLLPPSRAP